MLALLQLRKPTKDTEYLQAVLLMEKEDPVLTKSIKSSVLVRHD